jgi:hypothetical protein
MGYLDPGLFGMLSQVGLTVLLLAVSAFTFFFKPIKKAFLRLIKGKKAEEEPAPSNEDPSNS